MIFSLLAMIAVLVAVMAMFGVVTTAADAATGYVPIPEAVRQVYSKEILYQAQPVLRFLQFAKRKTDLLSSGKGVTFIKYNNLTGGSVLTENTPIVPVGLSASEITINVAEHGNAVQVSERLLRTSMHDVLGDASRLLAQNMATYLDNQFRTTCLLTTNVVYGNGEAAASTLAVGDGLDTDTIKNAVELLATNNAPRIGGQYYVCIASPHQIRQLRDDPAWIDSHKYKAGDRQLYIGEAGMYEGVVFIETTQIPATLAAAINGAQGYTGFVPAQGWEAVMFGENAFGWGVTLPVELRDGGVVDFGRQHGLAWYGIWGTGLIEPKNIVKILTA